MRLSQSVLLGLLASLTAANSGCEFIDGNNYCKAVSKVSYAGIGFSSSYEDVTKMSDDGSCSQESHLFSGNLSPLDEELSLHFRGPLKLKQFGVYYPASKDKREEEDCDTTLLHKHHLHKRATQVVEVTQTIYVDAEGNTQTSQGTTTATVGDGEVEETSTPVTSTTSAPESTSTGESEDDSDDESSTASPGDWKRSSYYTPGTGDNVVFLNHHGGEGSGVFDYNFGNSISYSNKDCSGGASEATLLDDVTIDSNTEYMIMSNKKCDGDDCGYYREGIPAYHGFGGQEKMFVFEFQMPEASGSKTAINYDMPAIWALNAKIPRTLQYGKKECSCWASGCGELDLFEVLSKGSNKLTSHLHTKQGPNGNTIKYGGGGSSDYFERPYDKTVKAAVIFNGKDVEIMKVDDDFDEVITKSTVNKWLGESGSKVTIGY